jgi:predicted O-methyltransferase YrrM
LEKTRALLAQFKAASFVEDHVECYDEAEIAELGRLLAGLVYAPSKLRKKLQSMGVTLTRADYHSEIPSIRELEDSFSRPSKLRLDAIFPDPAFLETYLRELTDYSREFDPDATSARSDSYAWDSRAFSYSDAMSYYAMIRRIKPRTILELGCGASTLIAKLACERNGFGRIVAVEPHPAAFLKTLGNVEIVQTRVQDLDRGFIDASLQDGDMLFIDTTHTVKHDSDCLHIYLQLLPSIRHSVTVHAHDIFLPETLPLHYMRDQQIFWNEQYLLYAYMLHNARIKILYGSAYHSRANPDLLKAFMHGRHQHGGVSLWFEQAGLAPG